MSSEVLPISGEVKNTTGFLNKTKTIVSKICYVAFHALIAVAAAALFLYNPVLFAPLLFLGIILRDPLDTAFKNLHQVYMIQPLAATLIIFLGGILAFPASSWIACGLLALWCGKRLVDLSTKT